MRWSNFLLLLVVGLWFLFNCCRIGLRAWIVFVFSEAMVVDLVSHAQVYINLSL